MLGHIRILLTSSISVVLNNLCKKVLGICTIEHMYVHSFVL